MIESEMFFEMLYVIMTSRNTYKIKDFECFGEHCIINLSYRSHTAYAVCCTCVQKLWYNNLALAGVWKGGNNG